MQQVAWVDVYHRNYTMSQIDDSYLRNILNFIYRGGGYDEFLTEEKISDLYREAKNRGIKLRFTLKSLINIRF